MRGYITHAFVIGVGSAQGARIPIGRTELTLDDDSTDQNTDASESKDWVIDPSTGKPGISKLDEKNLRNIADELSGKYVHIVRNATIGSEAKSILSHQWRMNETAKPRLRPEPVIWPFAALAAALLLWELIAWLITSRKLV